MAAFRFLVVFTLILCCVMCQLNLSEDSPCSPEKAHNGTCVKLNKCGSAVLTYLYRNAGFDENILPKLPEICSHKNDMPIVCCTDCVINDKNQYKESAVAPHGILVSRHGPKAWRKCLDYFHKLPYPCHGEGKVDLKKSWQADYKCHDVSLKVEVAIGRHTSESWMFPHLALLGYGDPQSLQWLCEGTVITEKYILTAARCTNAGVLGNVAVAAVGLKSRSGPINSWNRYDIKKIIKHPEYNAPSWYHDIALLETEEIRFDRDVLPACLDVGMHDPATAETSGILVEKLNQTGNDFELIYTQRLTGYDCALTYRASNFLIHGYNEKLQMCYKSHNKTVDTCRRVSGSPLQIDQFKCQYTVIGLTPQPKECGKSNVPDLYTRIHHYVPWIEKIVWADED